MKPQKRSRPEAETKDDAEMSGTTAGRKIVKAKRKLQQKETDKMVDEDGNELSFEDDDDSWEDAEGIDEQEVVQEDFDEGEKMEEEMKAGEVPEEMKEGEQGEEEGMDFDASAYEMLHRTTVEFPCLSLDVLVRDRCTTDRQNRAWFPSQVANSLTPQNSIKDKRLDV